jgi:hypothetical protein
VRVNESTWLAIFSYWHTTGHWTHHHQTHQPAAARAKFCLSVDNDDDVFVVDDDDDGVATMNRPVSSYRYHKLHFEFFFFFL